MFKVFDGGLYLLAKNPTKDEVTTRPENTAGKVIVLCDPGSVLLERTEDAAKASHFTMARDISGPWGNFFRHTHRTSDSGKLYIAHELSLPDPVDKERQDILAYHSILMSRLTPHDNAATIAAVVNMGKRLDNLIAAVRASAGKEKSQ